MTVFSNTFINVHHVSSCTYLSRSQSYPKRPKATRVQMTGRAPRPVSLLSAAPRRTEPRTWVPLRGPVRHHVRQANESSVCLRHGGVVAAATGVPFRLLIRKTKQKLYVRRGRNRFGDCVDGKSTGLVVREGDSGCRLLSCL